jgi:outer membrane protein TolC
MALAAFYFSPELDVARAQWGTAHAGWRTVGQRPNPTVTASPQYTTTTLTPSPWIAAVNLDIPIKTAGKRGHRLAQARHLSDAAKLNIASTAWRVRGKLRRALVDYAASEAALRLEVATQYPDIHLNPGYEYDQGDNRWGVGLSLELSVLNQNQGPIAEADARRTESAAKFNALQARGVVAYRGAGWRRIAARLARADAVAKAQQALGQLEEALPSPVGLPADGPQILQDPKITSRDRGIRTKEFEP